MIQRKKHRLILIILFILLFFIAVFSCTIGAANITFIGSLKILISKLPLIEKFINLPVDEKYILIILKIRLPRVVLSALIGAGLSVVGITFQAMFKNPMADPYVLGISSGAAFGAAIGMVLGAGNHLLGISSVTGASFLGAILTALVVYEIARVGNQLPTNTLLLSGIAIGFLLSSSISLLMIFNKNQIEKIVFWTMGSLASASIAKVFLLTPIILIGMFICFIFARELNVMSTSDETAKSLGINIELIKKIIILVSSLIVAACVSTTGIIGFVGLVMPHIVRILTKSSDNRLIMPYSMIIGAIFMILCDTLARSIIAPLEIPVGAITSLLGAPYFIFLLIKSKRHSSSASS